jgi:hypothetical protein
MPALDFGALQILDFLIEDAQPLSDLVDWKPVTIGMEL